MLVNEKMKGIIKIIFAFLGGGFFAAIISIGILLQNEQAVLKIEPRPENEIAIQDNFYTLHLSLENVGEKTITNIKTDGKIILETTSCFYQLGPSNNSSVLVKTEKGPLIVPLLKADTFNTFLAKERLIYLGDFEYQWKGAYGFPNHGKREYRVLFEKNPNSEYPRDTLLEDDVYKSLVEKGALQKQCPGTESLQTEKLTIPSLHP